MNARTLFAVVVVGIIFVYGYYAATAQRSVLLEVPSAFSVGAHEFSFNFTAADSSSRDAGLMGKLITNSTFMLFVFPSSGFYRFWMYNTPSSLDIIWVEASGSTGEVVHVESRAEPCYNRFTCPTFSSPSPANYVIEAKAGFAAANLITTGSTISLEGFSTMQVSG